MAMPKVLADIREVIDESITATSAVVDGTSIVLTLPTEVSTGSIVKFQAPCDFDIVNIININNIDYQILDTCQNTPLGAWTQGSIVSVLLDCDSNKAYIQNNEIYGETGQFVGFDNNGKRIACGERVNIYKENVTVKESAKAINSGSKIHIYCSESPTYNKLTDEYEFLSGDTLEVTLLDKYGYYIPSDNSSSYISATEARIDAGGDLFIRGYRYTYYTMIKSSYMKFSEDGLYVKSLHSEGNIVADDFIDSNDNKLSDKQDKLTGKSGQIVGFDSDGNMQAKDNPALLLEGGTMTGTIDVSNHGIKLGKAKIYGGGKNKTEYGYMQGPGMGMMSGTLPDPPVNAYCDSVFYTKGLVALNKQIKGVADPTAGYDAANKLYVDNAKPQTIMITLSASAWDSSTNTQTVIAQGVLSDEIGQLIIPTPAISSQSAYYEAGIICSGQDENSLTFTATSIPTTDLVVYISLIGAVSRIVDISIVGSGDLNKCYILIGGNKYYTDNTIKLNKGDIISCHVESDTGLSSINLYNSNNTVSNGDYDLTVDSNTEISFSQMTTTVGSGESETTVTYYTIVLKPTGI